MGATSGRRFRARAACGRFGVRVAVLVTLSAIVVPAIPLIETAVGGGRLTH
jgi:hypothetical protein